jgi:hypothetical protein
MQTGVASYYWARWNGTVNGWQLFKTVNASSTQMGTTVPGTFTSGSKVLRLTVNGSTISLSVDGVQLLSVTDTSITTAGKAGVRMGATQTANTGIHIDSITAVAI